MLARHPRVNAKSAVGNRVLENWLAIGAGVKEPRWLLGQTHTRCHTYRLIREGQPRNLKSCQLKTRKNKVWSLVSSKKWFKEAVANHI